MSILSSLCVREAMSELARAAAHEAVLKESSPLPEDLPQIKGYDFNQGVDHKALLESYLTTGFQASSFAQAVQEINKMIEKRLEPLEEVGECDTDSQQPRSGCTIFLGYTSNLISNEYLLKHKKPDLGFF
uniref:Deoxyhypusine synthase n=1 Tax=Paramormyrops kingsleyae TaxID=1676925 RepID=A0A3B3RML9_9TELE